MNNKIIYLLRNSPSDLALFEISIESLVKNFLEHNDYPIYVFHEGIPVEFFSRLESKARIKLCPQLIEFKLPPHMVGKDFPDRIHIPNTSLSFSVGYRHMCRFYTGAMYNEPCLQGTDYYLRLDNDSFILSPVKYDIFKFMQEHDIVYGYNCITTDNPFVVKGLWESCRDYAKMNKVAKTPYDGLPYPYIYYTNFETGKFSWFLEPKYQDFYEFIDRSGGIYYHRWGDSAIKYLGIGMLLDERQIHNFRDIHYEHGAR